MSVKTLFDLLGFPIFPAIGKEKFYHDNTTFNQNVKVTGQLVAQSNSLTLGEKAICGNLFMVINPFDKKPYVPNIIGTGGKIINFSGAYLFGGLSFISRNLTVVGRTNLIGRVYVNGKNLEAEIALAKKLPSSDERLKENIKTIENAIDKVSSLRGVEFEFKEDHKKQIGVIAQEVEKVIPQVVGDNPDGFKGVQYGNLVGLLIEAIKEQQKQIEELKDKVNEISN
jgi:hypothetical protein